MSHFVLQALNQDIANKKSLSSVHHKINIIPRLSIEEYGQQEKSLMAELQKGKHRSEELNEELGQVLQELRNASLDNQECKRQLQRNELLMRLQRLYPESVVREITEMKNINLFQSYLKST